MNSKENLSPLKKIKCKKEQKKLRRKQKEEGFVLNCINQAQSQLPAYDSTRDKYLRYFFIRTSKNWSQNKRNLCSSVQNYRWKPKHYTAGTSEREALELPHIKFKSGEHVSKEEFDMFLKEKRELIR